jgi:hypothetical protein
MVQGRRARVQAPVGARVPAAWVDGKVSAASRGVTVVSNPSSVKGAAPAGAGALMVTARLGLGRVRGTGLPKMKPRP